VKNCFDLERIWIGEFIGCDQAGSHGCERVEKLATAPLAPAFLFLPIAGADVVATGVTENIFQSVGTTDILAPPPDNNGQFAFLIYFVAFQKRWNLNGIIWVLKRVQPLDEKDRIFRNFRPTLRRVLTIIQSNA